MRGWERQEDREAKSLKHSKHYICSVDTKHQYTQIHGQHRHWSIITVHYRSGDLSLSQHKMLKGEWGEREHLNTIVTTLGMRFRTHTCDAMHHAEVPRVCKTFLLFLLLYWKEYWKINVILVWTAIFHIEKLSNLVTKNHTAWETGGETSGCNHESVLTDWNTFHLKSFGVAEMDI